MFTAQLEAKAGELKALRTTLTAKWEARAGERRPLRATLLAQVKASKQGTLNAQN
jgi:hypothetical protein